MPYNGFDRSFYFSDCINGEKEVRRDIMDIQSVTKRLLSEHRSYKEMIILSIITFCGSILLLSAGGQVGVPIASGFLAALVMGRKNPLAVGIGFSLATLFFGENVFFAGIAAATVIAIALGFAVKNNKNGYALTALIMIIAEAVYLFNGLNSTETLFIRILGITGSLISALCFFTAFKNVMNKGLRCLPSGEQLVCIAAVGCVLVMGLHRFEIFGMPISLLFVPCAVMLVTSVFESPLGISCAVILGLGCSVSDGNPLYVAMFSVAALCGAFFCRKNYVLAVITSMTAYICVYLLFAGNQASFVAVLFIMASLIGFMAIPKKVLSKAHSRFYKGERYSSRHIVNRMRAGLSNRLYELSEVFFSMQLGFRSMVRGVMPTDKAKTVIAKEVMSQACYNCPEHSKCWRVNMNDTENSFINMTGAALDKGRATVLDVNNALAARCGRINSVISAVNSEVFRYKQYYTLTVNSDNGKNLIAEQMMGVSNILSQLSRDSKSTVSFNNAKEKEFIEALSGEDIFCKEAVFYDDGKNKCITLVIDADDLKKQGLSMIVSRALGQPVMLDKAENTEEGQWKVVHFVPRPVFDVYFGFACEKKYESDVSGDTHSFLRISGDKFLLALCDGMGSGRNAEQSSARAVSLVENFYKAGFDNETVLRSVNRLLATADDESFTAVDIAVIDLKSGLADFIKIGSPAGMIRHAFEAEYIDGGSLPMGILEEMRPVITKKVLVEGDYVYLFSDGVQEAFGGKDNLGAFVASITEEDAQVQADGIMQRAKELSPQPKDDMTVIVARVVASEC